MHITTYTPCDTACIAQPIKGLSGAESVTYKPSPGTELYYLGDTVPDRTHNHVVMCPLELKHAQEIFVIHPQPQ